METTKAVKSRVDFKSPLCVAKGWLRPRGGGGREARRGEGGREGERLPSVSPVDNVVLFFFFFF